MIVLTILKFWILKVKNVFQGLWRIVLKFSWELYCICRLLLPRWSILLYFLRYFLYLHFKCYPLSWSPPKKKTNSFPPLASMWVFPHSPTPISSPLHSLTLGHPAVTGSRAVSPIDAQQTHPLLHMQLEPWVPPCGLLGWWFSPWELCRVWLVDIFALSVWLQTSLAPLVLSLTRPLGSPCSVQYLAASICLSICQTLKSYRFMNIGNLSILWYILLNFIFKNLKFFTCLDRIPSRYFILFVAIVKGAVL